jgi:hypothetical protein
MWWVIYNPGEQQKLFFTWGIQQPTNHSKEQMAPVR